MTSLFEIRIIVEKFREPKKAVILLQLQAVFFTSLKIAT